MVPRRTDLVPVEGLSVKRGLNTADDFPCKTIRVNADFSGMCHYDINPLLTGFQMLPVVYLGCQLEIGYCFTFSSDQVENELERCI